MEYKDYYKTLGVSKTASADEIQKAYRKLARKYHPDVNQTAGAEEKFKEITESYEVLKDSEKRQTYDRFGADWKRYGGTGSQPPPGFENFNFGGGGASGFSSFFETLFGGGGSPFGGGGNPFAGAGAGNPFAGGGNPFGGGGFASRGQNQEATIALSLEEAAAGGKREISLSDPTTGGVKSYSIKLPRGVKAGQKMRLAGRGAPGAGGAAAGDLVLTIEHRPHHKFRLEGQDLHTDLMVSPWEAALGGQASVPTLDGSLQVKVPAGSSTGRKIRLRGKGFPNPKGNDGDLYAEIRIAIPDQLSDKERELFEELAEVSSFVPR